MTRDYRLILFLLLATVILPAAIYAAGLNVPATSPVYDFLRRLETQGTIRGLNDLALPLTRDEIVAFLRQAEQNDARLSRVEKKILREYLADYCYETERQVSGADSIAVPLFQKGYFGKAFPQLFSRQDAVEENHFLMYEKGETFFWFDVGARGRMDWKGNHQKQMFSDKYMFRGALGKSFTFHTSFARFAVRHNPAFTEPYDEERGMWSMFQADSTITFDNIQSSLVYHNANFDLGLYRQPVSWGAGGTNNLILSKSAPLFSYIGFNTQYRGIKLTFMHGSLMNDSTQYRNIPTETRNRPKYLAAHRIDIPFFKGSTIIGFSEMVIYGDRNMEVSYLMPFGFYWPAGHALEDRDNLLMSMDFKTTFLRNVTFYGSVLIDEMRFGELGKHWWANKHALQAGTRLSPTLAFFPVDIQLEFTAVRPWTYSHKTLSTDYTQNGICLGFPYDANAQAWYLKVGAAFSRRFSVSGDYLHLRQGTDDENNYWGGDPTVSYELRNPNYDHSTKWLMGDIKTADQVKIIGSYELFNDFFLKSGATFYSTELNGQHESHRFGYIEMEVNF